MLFFVLQALHLHCFPSCLSHETKLHKLLQLHMQVLGNNRFLAAHFIAFSVVSRSDVCSTIDKLRWRIWFKSKTSFIRTSSDIGSAITNKKHLQTSNDRIKCVLTAFFNTVRCRPQITIPERGSAERLPTTTVLLWSGEGLYHRQKFVGPPLPVAGR